LVIKYDAPLPPDPKNKYLCSAIHTDGRALMIVRLQLLWGQFCRELVVTSALGGCQTITGTVLGPGAAVTSLNDIKRVVKKETKGRPPPWHKPRFAVTIAQNLGAQNFRQLQLALSRVSPVDDLKIVRDYIVHPWKSTRLAYIQVSRNSKASGINPVSLLAIRESNGNNIFKNWVIQLQNMALDAIR
jgi:hypothetical protein